MTFGAAYAKSQLAANQRLPLKGTVFVSMSDRDKAAIVPVVQELQSLGFRIIATEGTRNALLEAGLSNIELILKLHEGRPHVLDAIKNEQIHLILNTPSGQEARTDAQLIRRTALAYKIPIVTTIAAPRRRLPPLKPCKPQPSGYGHFRTTIGRNAKHWFWQLCLAAATAGDRQPRLCPD